MNLYSISAAYRADLDALAELDIDPVTARDTLEGMQGDLEDKLRAVIAYALNRRAQGAAQADAAKRMAERAKASNKHADRLFEYALQAMQATGLPGIDTPEFSAKAAKTPPSVQIDESLLPAAFWRTVPETREPDKQAAGAALKAGREVPGAILVHGWRLAIR